MNFGNVITAMITPFHSDGKLNYEAAQQLACHLLANGSHALIIAGTTGESPTLAKEEKLNLFAAVGEAIKGKAPYIAGTGSYDTAGSVALSKKAAAAGADGILAVVPYYSKPPQDGLYRHFAAIAKASDLPVILYNIPSRTGINMLPETIAQLAEIENIVAIKESPAVIDQISEIRSLTDDDFLIYSGDDALTLPMLALGAKGVVSVAAHLVGKEIGSMVAAFDRGDNKKALALHKRLFPLFKKLFINANPIPLKYCLNKQGFDAGPCRLPLTEPTPEQKTILDQVLKTVAG
ncbi:MAG: 4-hydroxy-tetrahydrodipicolinate synthase [Clostridiales bacterium]|jgi:4-hydroxy-tetrahydrodipicolinate synthase|nr:4-hydroxy-tetrahydrodipicolinate synthase [Clostridiales bacterium]MDR2712103.1 4-hydroxy-tetrahydrodipicolinate synthase [Clostridiales bacterium]